jgi:hypothetical protein
MPLKLSLFLVDHPYASQEVLGMLLFMLEHTNLVLFASKEGQRPS